MRAWLHDPSLICRTTSTWHIILKLKIISLITFHILRTSTHFQRTCYYKALKLIRIIKAGFSIQDGVRLIAIMPIVSQTLSFDIIGCGYNLQTILFPPTIPTDLCMMQPPQIQLITSPMIRAMNSTRIKIRLPLPSSSTPQATMMIRLKPKIPLGILI